jgi:pimeloyl-ACP methyl ester carboxylesterase
MHSTAKAPSRKSISVTEDSRTHAVHYVLRGETDGPVVTFLNGLTQNSKLWQIYADHLVDRGYRVLLFDMLGQGQSIKPVLGTALSAQADLLHHLLSELDIQKTHLAGISFGGIIALDFATRYGDKLQSLIAMSTLAELTPQLEHLGAALLQGLTEVGLPYLQGLLYPMNMSSQWLAANRERIPEMKRAGYISNDAYAMQNLMESFAEFKPLTPLLHNIQVPTLILNGEFDFFTPRICHEILRREISSSRLVIMPNAYHAFTLEMPALTLRQIEHFLQQVTQNQWPGDQSVWIAEENPESAELLRPFEGDWLRAIPMPGPSRSQPND